MWCIVVAAGSGRRFGAAKQFLDLAGVPVLRRSLDTAVAACDGVVVVLPASSAAAGFDHCPVDLPDGVIAVGGGATRSASVRAGLGAVPEEASVVLVHDAARPLASVELYGLVIAGLEAAEAAVPAVPVTDTICTVDAVPVDRETLRAVQTPQGFRAAALRQVHARPVDATDDASLIAAAGGVVALVDGEPTNLKITGPQDLAVAAALLGLAGTDADAADSVP